MSLIDSVKKATGADKLVSSLTGITDKVLGKTSKITNTASGFVPDEGANEASKRFLMYQQHTNRPKASQQFYVLFQPRPETDLICQNGTAGQPSGLMSDLKAWGKRQLHAAGDYLKSLTKDDSGTGSSWLGDIADSVGGAYKAVKETVKGAISSVKGVIDDVKGFISDAKDYIFGTSGKVVLYKPSPFYAMGDGWLSQFANQVRERAAFVEFGLFSDEDSYDALVRMCDEASMQCVDTTRPSWEMPVKKYNQYNHDILIYEKVKYKTMSMTFYDTLDSCLLKLLLFQLAFISDNYLRTLSHFTEFRTLENFMNNPRNWGMNVFSNTGIFQAISIVELFGDQCTVYNCMNPKITSVDLSKADATRSDVHKITITFEYEGLTNLNPTTLDKNEYDVMLAWAMTDSQKAAKIASAVRMRYESSLQQSANMVKDFFGPGSFKSKLEGLGQMAGFGSEIKFAKELTGAVKKGNVGSFAKQLVNPSSITSKITRIF